MKITNSDIGSCLSPPGLSHLLYLSTNIGNRSPHFATKHETIYFGHPERSPLMPRAVLTQINTSSICTIHPRNPTRLLYLKFHAFVRLFVMLSSGCFWQAHARWPSPHEYGFEHKALDTGIKIAIVIEYQQRHLRHWEVAKSMTSDPISRDGDVCIGISVRDLHKSQSW